MPDKKLSCFQKTRQDFTDFESFRQFHEYYGIQGDVELLWQYICLKEKDEVVNLFYFKE